MKVNGKFIHSRMYDMGIKTKKDFLTKINMHSDTFLKKLKGERDWKLDELWRLSQALDCEISELLIKGES